MRFKFRLLFLFAGITLFIFLMYDLRRGVKQLEIVESQGYNVGNNKENKNVVENKDNIDIIEDDNNENDPYDELEPDPDMIDPFNKEENGKENVDENVDENGEEIEEGNGKENVDENIDENGEEIEEGNGKENVDENVDENGEEIEEGNGKENVDENVIEENGIKENEKEIVGEEENNEIEEKEKEEAKENEEEKVEKEENNEIEEQEKEEAKENEEEKVEKEENNGIEEEEKEDNTKEEELNPLMDKSKEPVDDLYMEIIQDGKKLDEKFVTEIREMKRYRGGPLEPEWKWIEDISIVYTWVNGSDLNHLDLKSKYNGGNRGIDNRDRSVDELRYSLRSLEKYLPWHKGTIYIVSPNQVPIWLNTNSRVKVINQDDILPPNVAPTFNTFTIELFLDKIPGITERFIQLNDDYFFKTYTHPSFFFTSKGFYPKFYQSNKGIGGGINRAIEITNMDNAGMIKKFQGSVFNTNQAIRDAFGDKNRLKWLDHSPYNWYRDLFEPARQLFKKQVQDTISHKFRHPMDLVPPYLLEFYTYYATKDVKYPQEVGGDGLASKAAPVKLSEKSTIKDFSCEIVPQEVRKEVIRFGSVYNNLSRNEKFFNEIANSTILMFNLNDDYKSREAGLQLLKFMRKQYPEVSSFELSDAEFDEKAIMDDINKEKEKSKDKNKQAEPVDDTSPREKEEIDFLLSYKGEELEPEWKWAEDISFVYSWVNGSDPRHLDLKAKYNGGQKKADNRDRSMDELRYSLRSFEKYLPWHKGKIYIVTPNQVPVWLDTDNPRIKVIDQDDIIPKEANPTFNSFLMEMYLDKIPGISERFVYLNDDYFFRTYTHPRFFFAEKNFAPKFYLGKKVPYGMKKALEMNENKDKLSMIKKFQSAVFYTNGIVKEAFGNSLNIRWLDHSPYSWYRDLFEPARQLFSKYVKQSLTHRFRDSLDIIPTYAFQAYVMYAAAVPNFPEYVGGDGTAKETAPLKLNKDRTIEVYDFDIVSPNVREKTIKFGSVYENIERNERLYNDIRNSTVLLYNLNDDYKSEKAGENLVKFMSSMYPDASAFELSEKDVEKRLKSGFDGSIKNLKLEILRDFGEEGEGEGEGENDKDKDKDLLTKEKGHDEENEEVEAVDAIEEIDVIEEIEKNEENVENEENEEIEKNEGNEKNEEIEAIEAMEMNEEKEEKEENINVSNDKNLDDLTSGNAKEDEINKQSQGSGSGNGSGSGKEGKFQTDSDELNILLNYDGGELEPEWEWAKDISIVYTWINGSDINHLDLKAKYNGGNRKVNNRDRSVGELRYSLRSLEKYLPWHRGMIYIVTPNQTPDFIDIHHPRIKIINQDDLFPEHVAPTFNSFIIELYLDKIPGISERFIQLNDDYFFNNYCHPSFFFTSEGYPKFYRTNRKINPNRKSAELIAKAPRANMIRKFHGSIYNTSDAVRTAFGNKAFIYWLDHSPYCWYRDLFEPARKVYEKQVNETLLHKFRHPLDLVPTYANQAFIQYATAPKEFPEKIGGSGKAKSLEPLELNSERTIKDYSFRVVPQRVRRKIIKFGSILNNIEKNERLFKLIVGSQIIMYNLNDDYQKKEARDQLVGFMKSQYPNPSSFEAKDYLKQEEAEEKAALEIEENPNSAEINVNSNSNSKSSNSISDREKEEIDFLLNYHGEALSEEWKWAENISIVYIWTDNSDPEYIALRKKYTSGKINTNKKKYDELQYSLRSLDKYLPWHKGKIYIVTPGQTPSWLDTSNKRIQIVHQDDILPSNAKPSFNILVLEMFLDKIPGITERFIYLNNNHYFKEFTHPRLFFSKDFGPKYYLSRKVSKGMTDALSIAESDKLKNYKKYQSSLYYTNGIVKEAFGESTNIRYVERAPYAWYRDLFEPARILYEKYVEKTLHYKFIDALNIVPIYALQSFNIYGAANPFFPKVIAGDGKGYWEYSDIELNKNRTIDFYSYDIVSPNVSGETIITTMIGNNKEKNIQSYEKIKNSSVLFFSMKIEGNEKKYYDDLFEFMNKMYSDKSSFEKNK